MLPWCGCWGASSLAALRRVHVKCVYLLWCACSDQGAYVQLTQLCQHAVQRGQQLQQALQAVLAAGASSCEGAGSEQWQQLVQEVHAALGRQLQELQTFDALYQQVCVCVCPVQPCCTLPCLHCCVSAATVVNVDVALVVSVVCGRQASAHQVHCG